MSRRIDAAAATGFPVGFPGQQDYEEMGSRSGISSNPRYGQDGLGISLRLWAFNEQPEHAVCRSETREQGNPAAGAGERVMKIALSGSM